MQGFRRSSRGAVNKIDYFESGFTIVELLVVIVIIGILAAITIVSYVGISSRATASSLQSNLANSAQQIKLYNVDHVAYPTGLNTNNCPTGPVIDPNYCLKTSSGTTYSINANNSSPSVFCLTATKSGQSYYVNQSGSPFAGSCTTTNLDTNPSFESATTFLTTAGQGGNLTGLNHSDQDTTHVLYGTYAAMDESNKTTGQYFLKTQTPFTPIVGDTYFFSAYVYLPIGSTITNIFIGIRDSITWNYLSSTAFSTLTPGSWTRISCSYTATSANPQWVLTIADPNGVTPGNPQFYWIDGVMLTDSSNLQNYADGTSRDWSWNGTPNSSTSTGPAY
jgi:prepilin-type N-terminal cleavage/methylation domain-containing protein